MFLINGMKATLRQFNRPSDDSQPNNNVYDDRDYKDIIIKCCPYDITQGVAFGIYTHPEATGYYMVRRWVDVREGDQITFIGNYVKQDTVDTKKHTILKVDEAWIFNRIEYKVIQVK